MHNAHRRRGTGGVFRARTGDIERTCRFHSTDARAAVQAHQWSLGDRMPDGYTSLRLGSGDRRLAHLPRPNPTLVTCDDLIGSTLT